MLLALQCQCFFSLSPSLVRNGTYQKVSFLSDLSITARQWALFENSITFLLQFFFFIFVNIMFPISSSSLHFWRLVHTCSTGTLWIVCILLITQKGNNNTWLDLTWVIAVCLSSVGTKVARSGNSGIRVIGKCYQTIGDGEKKKCLLDLYLILAMSRLQN